MGFLAKQLNELVEAVAASYPQTLGQQVVVTLLSKVGIDFFRASTPGSTFDATLLGILRNQNETKEGLAEFVAELTADGRPQVMAALSKIEAENASPIAPVRAHLISLHDVSRRPEVKRVLLARRAELEFTSERLGLVRTYKDLHDILHDIQKECYDLMALELIKVSDQSFEFLQDYYDTYCVYWARLEEIAQSTPVANSEVSSIRRRMSPIEGEWKAGLRERDIRRIFKVEMQLRGALSNLSLVNSLLHRSAADMLPSLIRLMDGLSTDLSAITSASDIDLKGGLDQLRRVGGQFDALVQRHHRWQEVDNEIRRIAEFLPDIFDEVAASWPFFEGLVTLLAEPGEIWCQPLLQRQSSLQSALGLRDCALVEKHFLRFRKISSDVFYSVDKRLKSQCEQLPGVASALTLLWEGA